jgi:NADPH2:quinone reductase
MVKNIEVSGLQISDYRKRRPGQVAACFAEVFELYGEGKIRPPEVITLPLDRAAEGLALVRDRATDGRRVVLLPGGVGTESGRPVG